MALQFFRWHPEYILFGYTTVGYALTHPRFKQYESESVKLKDTWSHHKQCYTRRMNNQVQAIFLYTSSVICSAQNLGCVTQKLDLHMPKEWEMGIGKSLIDMRQRKNSENHYPIKQAQFPNPVALKAPVARTLWWIEAAQMQTLRKLKLGRNAGICQLPIGIRNQCDLAVSGLWLWVHVSWISGSHWENIKLNLHAYMTYD